MTIIWNLISLIRLPIETSISIEGFEKSVESREILIRILSSFMKSDK